MKTQASSLQFIQAIPFSFPKGAVIGMVLIATALLSISSVYQGRQVLTTAKARYEHTSRVLAEAEQENARLVSDLKFAQSKQGQAQLAQQKLGYS